MTDKEKLIAIRTKIERQIAELYPTKEKIGIVGIVGCAAVKRHLESIISFMDSMSEESMSESQSEKELGEAYLTVFDKKHPILPTLKGKQLTDFKNFLNKCQQEFGLKYFGARPLQAKLFEKMTLLWALWGAEHLQEIGMQDEKEQDIPVSEELEKVVEEIVDPTVLNAYGVKEIANRLRRTIIYGTFVSEELDEVLTQKK